MSILTRWLSKHPQPSKLVCTLEDGETKRIAIGLARSRWRDAESACAGALRVEALDDSGASLRALDLVDPDEPQLIKPKNDKESELVLIAGLLKDANAEAVRALSGAIDKQSELMGLWSQRLAQLEGAYHNLVLSAQPQVDANEAMGDKLAQIVVGKMLGDGGNGAAGKEAKK